MTSNGSLITQVAEHNLYNELIQDDYIRDNNLSSKPVKLDLRGERMDVDIETLVRKQEGKGLWLLNTYFWP